MKVYTHIVMDWGGNVLEQDFYEHEGLVVECKGGGSQTTTTTQNQQPWAEQQPYLLQGFEEAQKQLQGPSPQYYPDSTVVPFSPESEAAMGMRTGQANDPNSLINQAGGELSRTLGGEYLQADNPVFQQMLQGITGAVRPGVDSSFAGAGRFGSPLHAEALSRGISAGMLPFISQERGRQYGAIGDAFPVSQYAPGLLQAVGQQREGMSRNVLQDLIDRFNFGENIDAAKLQQYMGAITGNYGGTTTGQATQPLYSNPLMTGLGMASSAAGIGSTLFGPPGGGGLFSGK